jgi:hypothetical protein
VVAEVVVEVEEVAGGSHTPTPLGTLRGGGGPPGGGLPGRGLPMGGIQGVL